MTSALVEILTFPASEAFINHVSVADDALQLIRATGGSLQAFCGSEVEDNRTGYVLQVWESPERHKQFVEHPNFAAMRVAFEKCIDCASSRAPTVARVPLTAQNETFQQPILQIISGKLKDVEFKPAANALVRAIMDRECNGKAIGGPTIEEPDCFIVVLGVRTIERDEPNDAGARVMHTLSQYMDMDRRHVWVKPFTGLNQTEH